MANIRITVTFDGDKLEAMRQFMGKDSRNIETLLQEQLEKIYTKAVPVSVRQYIEVKAKSASESKPKAIPKLGAPINTDV